MNWPGAIVLSTGIIAGALLITTSGHSQTAGIGNFNIATEIQSSPDGGVWVLKGNGELRFCDSIPGSRPVDQRTIECTAAMTP